MNKAFSPQFVMLCTDYSNYAKILFLQISIKRYLLYTNDYSLQLKFGKLTLRKLTLP